MARNPKNNEACDVLAVAISTLRRTGVAAIDNEKVLLAAYAALLAEPAPCREDCRYKNRRQKCHCCARNYRNMKDCYERIELHGKTSQ